MFIGMVTDCTIFKTVRLNTKPYFNFIILIVRLRIVYGYFILFIIFKHNYIVYKSFHNSYNHV